MLTIKLYTSFHECAWIIANSEWLNLLFGIFESTALLQVVTSTNDLKSLYCRDVMTNNCTVVNADRTQTWWICKGEGRRPTWRVQAAASLVHLLVLTSSSRLWLYTHSPAPSSRPQPAGQPCLWTDPHCGQDGQRKGGPSLSVELETQPYSFWQIWLPAFFEFTVRHWIYWKVKSLAKAQGFFCLFQLITKTIFILFLDSSDRLGSPCFLSPHPFPHTWFFAISKFCKT